MQKPINPKEALKNRKKAESNKYLIIYSVIGIGIAVNLLIIYNNYIKIQYELSDLGKGHF